MSHALTTNVLDWMFSRAFRTHLAGKGAIFDLMQLNVKFKPSALIFLPLMTFFGRGFSQEEAVSFQLDMALERAKEGEWNLILDLDLEPGEWVVSSCSTDSMFGKVALWFHESQALKLLGSIEEIPPSQWEVEPFSQLEIKVIRRDTRMIQRLTVDPNHAEDIHGRVFFVLEPLCTPFETTFTLTNMSPGEWQVVHTGTHEAFHSGREPRH